MDASYGFQVSDKRRGGREGGDSHGGLFTYSSTRHNRCRCTYVGLVPTFSLVCSLPPSLPSPFIILIIHPGTYIFIYSHYGGISLKETLYFSQEETSVIIFSKLPLVEVLILSFHPSLILHSSFTHPSLILHSSFTHPSLILHSSFTHPSLILHSSFTHPSLILHSSSSSSIHLFIP